MISVFDTVNKKKKKKKKKKIKIHSFLDAINNNNHKSTC